MKHLIHGIGFSSTSAASKNERDTGKMIAIVLLPGGQMADDRQDDVQVSIVMNVGDGCWASEVSWAVTDHAQQKVPNDFSVNAKYQD